MLKRFSLVIFFISLNSYGFGVDVCFNNPDTKAPLIKNCLGVEKACRTSNLNAKQTIACRLKALYDGVSGLATKDTIAGARSLLHSDATYFMAQLIGFDAWQAYQMMIYSEATDQAEYTAFNQKGLQILTNDDIKQCRDHWNTGAARECLIITPEVTGISKFSFQTGGMLLHLNARFSSNGEPPPVSSFPTNYFSQTNYKYEAIPANFRAWVFDKRVDACAAGITQNMNLPDATHAPCEQSNHVLKSPMNFFFLSAPKLAIPFSTQLGTLIIETPDQNRISKPVLANNDSFQAYITPHDVSFAKMGIFVHALSDRYSHHMCTDHSYFYQTPDKNYTSAYSSLYCAQGSHFLWHVWEQGTNQTDANLKLEHQTMRPALEATFDQLLAYAKHKDIAINQTLDKQTIIDELILVLQTFDPTERLQKMVELMEKNNVLPLPGHGSVANDSVDKWLTLAGAPK